MVPDTLPSDTLADPDRLDALAATGLTEGVPDEALDRLTRLVQRCLHAPVALVSLVESDRQVFASAQGLSEPWCSLGETPLSHSFCQHVVTRNTPLRIEDARLDPAVRDNLAVSDLGVIAYLGVPLRTPDGHTLGSLCAIEGRSRAWTEGDLEIMEALAEAAMSEIASRWRLTAQADDLWQAVEQGRALVRVLFEDERPRALLHRGRIADANRALLGMLERSREAVVGERLSDVLSLGHSDAGRLADSLIDASDGDHQQLNVSGPGGDLSLRVTGVPGAGAALVDAARV